MQGRIIKQISNDYTVDSGNKKHVCKARGKFRCQNKTPLVGDMVEFDDKNNYILNILPRKNELIRPVIANIDQVIIVTSLKKPDFDTNLLDKLLCISEFNNIKPIIVFTKVDLLTEKESFKIYYEYYKSIYEVYMNYEVDSLKRIFKNKVSVLTGQSGAGKSTLLNKLNKDLNIKTAEISLALNRGKHTTRHTELLNVCDGLVADTPGFSALDFINMTNSDIERCFVDFHPFKKGCRYHDCMHDKERECLVKNKVDEGVILKSRYENYINFIRGR